MIRIVMLLFAAVFAVPGALAQHPSKVDAPAISKGERWAYATTDLWKNAVTEEIEVTATDVSDSAILLQNKDRAGKITSMRITRELNTVEADIANGTPTRRFNPHTSDFNFPLETGKCWKGTVLVDVVSTGQKIRWETNTCVLGWETMKDRSGHAHETMKVEKRATYFRLEPGGWSGTMKWTYWYSPQAKASVRIEYEDTNGYGQRYNYTRKELVSHEPTTSAGSAAAGASSPEKK